MAGMAGRLALSLCLCLCWTLVIVDGQDDDCESPDRNCNIVNVALNKDASQGSRYSNPEKGHSSGPAGLAVDGKVETCVHTSGFKNNDTDWWQVDLGANHTVTNITIYHRKGGPADNPHSQRIAGVCVYVNDTLCFQFPNSTDIGSEPKQQDDITCRQPIRGRVVRFSKEGNIHAGHFSFVNFCEVQIWVCKAGRYGPQCENECGSHCQNGLCDSYDGTCQSDMESPNESSSCSSPDGNCKKVNVAQGKVANMSARWAEPGKLPDPPGLAVDGYTSNTSCVHTLGSNDNAPDWWQVDLGQNYTVTHITIYHREGGWDPNPHSQRIAGVWVYVDQTLCYKFPNSLNIGSEHKKKDDITCQRPIRGRVVRLSKEGYIHGKHYSFINVCEVQVWVCKPGLYGEQCEDSCSPHCQQGLCDNYDGTCHVGCSGGYYGSDCSEQCGQCQKQDTCDQEAGRCPHGCQPGYQPPDCQYEIESTTESPPYCDAPDENCNKVNVAEGKEASMSLPYEQPGYSSGPAHLAVDGNSSTYYSSCVHTSGTTDQARDWWQVDLGHNYTVTDITVYHREGGPSPHPHSQRIAGVWVYVDGILCYKFPNSLNISREPKVKDDITCGQPIRGQVVRFVKKGFTHAHHYSFINFCEVQIWACKSGLYGRQCENTCNSQCLQGLCDNYDGTCDIGCSGGYYGSDCSEQCGQCQKQVTCDQQTGDCPHGCQPGYQPPDCQYVFYTTNSTSTSTSTSTTTTRKTTLTTTTISAAQSGASSTVPPGVGPSTDTSPILSTSSPSARPQGGNVVVVFNNSSSSSSSSGSRSGSNNSSSSSSSSGSRSGSNNSSISSSIPGRSDVSRQQTPSGNSGGKSSKEYTQGDMAGLGVSMILLGAVLGVAGLALYCRFFRKRAYSSDGIAFRLMEHTA